MARPAEAKTGNLEGFGQLLRVGKKAKDIYGRERCQWEMAMLSIRFSHGPTTHSTCLTQEIRVVDRAYPDLGAMPCPHRPIGRSFGEANPAETPHSQHLLNGNILSLLTRRFIGPELKIKRKN